MKEEILRTLSFGMYAIGVKGENRPSACIVNTVFQVTADPAMIAVSIHHDNYTNECIKKSGIFTVNVISENTSGKKTPQKIFGGGPAGPERTYLLLVPLQSSHFCGNTYPHGFYSGDYRRQRRL